MGAPPSGGGSMMMPRKKRSMTLDEFGNRIAELKKHRAQPVQIRKHFLVESPEIEKLADASRKWMFAKKHGLNSE